MTTYTTIIRGILRDNGIEADEEAVLAEMRRITNDDVDYLFIHDFIELCLRAEMVIRP